MLHLDCYILTVTEEFTQDEDNKDDPLNEVDLHSHLQQFLTQLSTHNSYNQLCQVNFVVMIASEKFLSKISPISNYFKLKSQ